MNTRIAVSGGGPSPSSAAGTSWWDSLWRTPAQEPTNSQVTGSALYGIASGGTSTPAPAITRKAASAAASQASTQVSKDAAAAKTAVANALPNLGGVETALADIAGGILILAVVAVIGWIVNMFRR